MTPTHYELLHWEMALRGAVAGLLLFHTLNLLLHRGRGAPRLALGGFTLGVFGYVFCQQPEMLLAMPRPLALGLLALAVSAPAWMWLAARALFDDGFRFRALAWGVAAAAMVLGLSANLPFFPPVDAPGSFVPPPPGSWVWVLALGAGQMTAMLLFTALALWEVTRGWRDDLVEPRRAARRWVALGIGVYAAVAVVVEIAVRGQQVGRLLPALHIAGIGLLALGLALLVALRSLDDVLGVPAVSAPGPDEAPALPASPPPADRAVPTSPRVAEAQARLQRAMSDERLYRREGLTLAALAQQLGQGEAALRALINQQLGFRNFNDFLHSYRLQEAAERLAADDRPVLTIALECGYGSIGPFNRAFKQRFGITPSEFRGAKRLVPGAAPS